MYHTKLDPSAFAWSPANNGISMTVLHRDEATGAMTSMTRMEPGSSIPAHRHTQADQAVYVLEGDLVDAGVSYGPGSFFLAKTGEPHGPHGTAGGCVLLSTFFGPPDFVPVG